MQLQLSNVFALYLLIALFWAVGMLLAMAVAAIVQRPDVARLLLKDLPLALVWPYLAVRTVVEWLQLLKRLRRQQVARKV